MSQHHQQARWASVSKGHRASIRAMGRAQLCIQPHHVADCPRMLDLDVDLWDVAHQVDLALGGNRGAVGPAFRRCNRSAGGAMGAAVTQHQRHARVRVRAW